MLSVRFRLVFLCLANWNRKFRFVKFWTEIDRNNWESIGFGLFRLWLVSVGFRLRERLLETKQEQSWWYISESETEKEKRKIKEKNKREESFREKRRGWCVELSWRPVCGGRSVEVGSKCGLMEASVCEMEWWRYVSVRDNERDWMWGR